MSDKRKHNRANTSKMGSNGNEDRSRHCTYCGQKILGYQDDFPHTRKVCPHSFCKEPIPFPVYANSFIAGYGRCGRCKAYIREYDCYCLICGNANWHGIKEKKRKDQVKLEEENAAKRRKLDDLQKTVDAQAEAMMQLKKELAAERKKNQQLAEKDSKAVEETVAGIDFDEDIDLGDDNDDVIPPGASSSA